MGYVYPLKADGKPDYSRVIACRAEGCEADQRRIFGLSEAYLRQKGATKFHTFETFKPVLGAEKALEAFRDIAFNPEAPPLLLVYGITGNGKTHLCEATLTELLKRGIECRMVAVADLISELKQSIPGNTTEGLISQLKTIPALILDEWGQNYRSDWEEQKIEEIIVARERAGLITIATTNLEPDQLSEYAERAISRFRDGADARLICNKAPNYRPKKRRGSGKRL